MKPQWISTVEMHMGPNICPGSMLETNTTHPAGGNKKWESGKGRGGEGRKTLAKKEGCGKMLEADFWSQTASKKLVQSTIIFRIEGENVISKMGQG